MGAMLVVGPFNVPRISKREEACYMKIMVKSYLLPNFGFLLKISVCKTQRWLFS